MSYRTTIRFLLITLLACMFLCGIEIRMAREDAANTYLQLQVARDTIHHLMAERNEIVQAVHELHQDLQQQWRQEGLDPDSDIPLDIQRLIRTQEGMKRDSQ